MLRQRSSVSRFASRRSGSCEISSESGNAIVEFVVVGVGLQLALLAFVTSMAAKTDSQSAADLLSRQALRALELGVQPGDLQLQIGQLASTLGLGSGDYSVTASGDCSSRVSVNAIVRSAKAHLDATCR